MQPSCAYNHIDLSVGAFQALGDQSEGVSKWHMIVCSLSYLRDAYILAFTVPVSWWIEY